MASDRASAASSIVLGLSFCGFVALGLPDGLIGVAWPSIRGDFGVPIDALGVLFVTATAGYVTSSIATGALLRKLGIGGLLAASCAMCAASMFGYAAALSWPVMACLGVFAGFGAGAIDSGLNTHAAVNYSSRTVNLLHAFYGIGTAAGPMVMTAAFASGRGWRTGYVSVALALFALTVAFALTRRRWPPPTVASQQPRSKKSLGDTLRVRAAWLSMVVFFLYVGLEATAGAWLYSLLHEARGVAMVAAGTTVSLYWLSLFGGRVAYALVPSTVHPRVVVAWCIASAVLGACLLLLDVGEGWSTVAAIVLGLACGPIFPSMISMTPARLGAEHTANAVGLQIAASGVGLALLPALAGVLARIAGLEALPIAMLVCGLLLFVTHAALDRVTKADAADARPDAATGGVHRS